RAAGAAILTGMSPTPVSLTNLEAATNWAKPLDQVQQYIVDRARKDFAKVLLERNVAEFRDELEKLHAKPAEAKEYVEKAAKEYGFTIHTMAAAKDQFALADDEALKGLREGLAKRLFAPVPLTKPEEFGENLLRRAASLYKPKADETSDD